MRRKDREMDPDFARDVIDRSQFGSLACVTPAGKPYVIPLSLVRKGSKLYFHSAASGNKVDLLLDGQEVSLCFVALAQVPNLFSQQELAAMQNDPDAASNLGSKVFTTEFESACAQGTIRELTGREEKIEGLRLICQKYTPDKMALFETAALGALNFTKVYEIEILSLTGKRKRFDENRKELKRAIES